jgi:hypothetical protein
LDLNAFNKEDRPISKKKALRKDIPGANTFTPGAAFRKMLGFDAKEPKMHKKTQKFKIH